MNKSVNLEKITSWAKRRGFVYPSSEIYGGLASVYDFGPYGVELKNNLKNLWWKTFVYMRDDMLGLDSGILMNPQVWVASGHAENFNDVSVDCKNCKTRHRADHLIEDKLDIKVEGLSNEDLDKLIEENNIKCPVCGAHDFTNAKKFNLMFAAEVGTIEGEKQFVYLRSELAQGMFVDFKAVINSTRKKLPFGIAQAGKMFRNEITKGQFLHRTIEVDLMEFEYFFNPEVTDWDTLFTEWESLMWDFAVNKVGIKEEDLQWRQHAEEELSHYSKRTKDIEYHYPFGWKEMFGVAYRTDFDLRNHSEKSGQDLSYFDDETKQKVIPHVIEPTFGLSRLVNIVLFNAYTEEEIKDEESGKTETRVVMKFAKEIAPVKVAVLPLMKKPELAIPAKELYRSIKEKVNGLVEYDEAGSIGKRYRRQDEIGTPICITYDYDSLDDHSVTIRDRDTMEQKRVKIEDIYKYI